MTECLRQSITTSNDKCLWHLIFLPTLLPGHYYSLYRVLLVAFHLMCVLKVRAFGFNGCRLAQGVVKMMSNPAAV